MNRQDRRAALKQGRLIERPIQEGEYPIGMLLHCRGRDASGCKVTLRVPLDKLVPIETLAAGLQSQGWILARTLTGTADTVCARCQDGRIQEPQVVSLLLKCPGKNGTGCETTLSVPVNKLWPFEALNPELSRGGWALAGAHDSASHQNVFDPLCGRCVGNVLDLDTMKSEEA